MMNDDGQMPENLEHADIVLVGVSRTSKTPTSIYLANRGYKTANVPFVPQVPLPRGLDRAAPAAHRRPDRLGRAHHPDPPEPAARRSTPTPQSEYIDRVAVAEEIAASRRFFAERRWPMIDVTRRSIEETAAAILDLYREHRLKFIAES